MNEKTTQRTTLYVPYGLWRKIRKLALDQKKKANTLAVEALEKIYGNEAKQI